MKPKLLLGLALVLSGGLAILFWLNGSYDHELKQEQLNSFKRAYFLPRGEIMRFEARDSDRFCKVHVLDEAALRQFMNSRDFTEPWRQGKFTAGVTNTVKMLAEEFHLPKDELPNLGHQGLKWQVGRNPKLLYEPLPYEYLCIVDEDDRTVWILGGSH